MRAITECGRLRAGRARMWAAAPVVAALAGASCSGAPTSEGTPLVGTNDERSGAGGTGVATGDGPGCGCAPPDISPGVWTEVAPPAGQAGFRATDSWAVAPDDLLFAGVVPTGQPGEVTARVLRWTRGCWTVELAIPVTTVALFRPSVHGHGPNDVWAVAGDVVYHKDAGGWARLGDEWKGALRPAPSFDDSGVSLVRVRAAGPGQAWVAERRHLVHFAGGASTVYSFDDADYPNQSASIGFLFKDLWIDGANDVWAVGGADIVGSTMEPGFVHHFDGASWSRRGVGRFGVDAIWRAGAYLSYLWLAQSGQVTEPYGDLTLRRFDPTTGEAPAVPVAGAEGRSTPLVVTSLWGRGDDELWGGGNDLARFDGTTWSIVSDAPASARSDDDGTHTPVDNANTHVTGDARSVWIATPGPRFMRKLQQP